MSEERLQSKEALMDTILYGSEDSLNELKAFLFRESIRLDVEKKELEELKERVIKEREQLRIESDEINHQIVVERKRLKDEQIFFDKKLNILRNGFDSLEADRRAIKRAKEQLEREKSEFNNNSVHIQNEEVASYLFCGVNSLLGLKKRYKDLLKIFHPDNMNGDHQMVLIINRIYDELKKNYESSKII